MCEFISWINFEGKLYFLTDADIFSDYGKKILSTKDNDPIGHTAIRIYYNLKHGEQHECQDVWNPSKFPPEIAEKLKDFDTNFGWTFAKHLQGDDLNYILANGPDEWKHRALKIILGRFNSGSLDLSGLTTLPADVTFPEKMSGSLDLSGLTTRPKGMKLPSYAFAPNLGRRK